MDDNVYKNKIYKKSENIIARTIENELILVPVSADIADLDASLFSLNQTGIEIWNRLDGKRVLNEIVQEFDETFDAHKDVIMKDVCGIIQELLKHGIIEKVK